MHGLNRVNLGHKLPKTVDACRAALAQHFRIAKAVQLDSLYGWIHTQSDRHGKRSVVQMPDIVMVLLRRIERVGHTIVPSHQGGMTSEQREIKQFERITRD